MQPVDFSMAEATKETTCVLCRKPGSRHCARCSIDSTASTHYCSRECQAADWSEHKTACKVISQRARSCRAGDMIQEALMDIAVETCGLIIQAVAVENGKIMTTVDGFTDANIEEFDAKRLAVVAASVEAKRAIATWSKRETLTWFCSDLIAEILKGQ
jgi:hypothetical protein